MARSFQYLENVDNTSSPLLHLSQWLRSAILKRLAILYLVRGVGELSFVDVTKRSFRTFS
jgi:hypothetical protein